MSVIEALRRAGRSTYRSPERTPPSAPVHSGHGAAPGEGAAGG
ncbi:hypothetical protein [Streptomyces alanosinicus]|nr:hypothetical protein [Streptomyces alanosinicus]